MKFRSILVHRLTFLPTAIIYVALLIPSTQAQFLWSQRIASANSLPEGEPNTGLTLDTNDNCYVTGFFDDTNNFGGVTLTNQSTGGSDIFVAKYNSAGALQWARRAGGSVGNFNYGRGIGVDTNGNIYVEGGYQSPATFGSINLPATLGEEFFLAKYNSAGAVQWVRTSTGGSDDNNGVGLTVDSSGNSYALAVLDHSGTSLTFGSVSVTAHNGGTTFLILVKYDNTGTAQWAQLFDSSTETYGSKLAVDATGNVYVRGTFYSDMTIGTSNLTASVGETKNMFIAKFNNSGALIWIQQPQGGNAGEGGVAVDPAGDVYVSGYFDTNLVFGGGITLTNMANTNSLFGDAFLAKYNSAGAIQWAQPAGGTNGGFYWDLSLDAQTNIYAGGFVGYNAAVAKYNPAGTLQWTYSASGTPASPVASGFGKCVVDSGGNCFLGGFYQGSNTFGAYLLTPQETYNFFLAEVAPYTFGPQTQSTPSANITYDSGTGLFQYTDAANSTDDSAKIPLTGTAATLITTSSNWTTSLTANISARAMTASVSESPHVWMQLGIYYSSGSSTYLLTFSLQQENNTGGNNNENFPNGFYGTGVTLRGRTNGNDDVTMPLGASQIIQGGSVLLLSGGTVASPATESISAATGILTLNYNASLNTVTGYYNGTPIGSYSLASWGANLPLTLFVAGSSGEGIGASAGTATASSFSVNTLTITNPTIQFTASPTNGAPPLTVHFNSASVDNLGNAITSWDWNFGDGATTNVQNPSHIYTSVGTFTPALVATNNNGAAVIGYGPQISTLTFTSATNFTYITNNGVIGITEYIGSYAVVSIPPTINGYPVIGILDGAFDGSDLTSVTIPNSVTYIAVGPLSESFSDCDSLTNFTVATSNPAYSSLSGVLFDKAQVTLLQFPGGLGGSYTISNSVTSIGDGAFEDCYSLTGVTIPNSVTYIGNDAFESCNMTSVTIPNSVTYIGDGAFEQCGNMMSVTIGNGVTNIGEYAFVQCTSLTSVTIPSGVSSISIGVFGGCNSLTNITVTASNSVYSSLSGVLFDKAQATLLQFPEGLGGSYTVPNSATSIGYGAFDGCTSLTSVTIPNSVSSIGYSAFSGCNMISVMIPNGVTNIGDYAFYDCTSLKSAYFQGNAPPDDGTVFFSDPAIVYYLFGTTGWGSTFGSRPTVLWNPKVQANGLSFGVRTNRFGFNITGSSNLVIVVEGSTNLLSWSPVSTNTLNTFIGTNGTSYFSDSKWTNYPFRFYRIRSQ